MNLRFLVASTLLAACSSAPQGTPPSSSQGTSSTESARPMPSPAPMFRPTATIWHGWTDFGSVRAPNLAVPVKRPAGLRIAVFQIYHPLGYAGEPVDEAVRERDKVTSPLTVLYGDPVTGKKKPEECLELDWDPAAPRGARAHFGLPTPADRVIGHFSDPSWPPEDRRKLLNDRIFAGLDILLPFFADENRPWTEEANKAAREVRDFFPLAAEPGLWPYYKAEGREFFAWLEKNAPPEKAPLPWKEAK